MNIFKAFLGFIASFLVIDGVWINLVAIPLYQNEISQLLAAQPRMGVAALFYLGYAAAAVHLTVRPATSGMQAAINGIVFGAATYGTYAVTNYAMLTDWTATLSIVDTVWGAILTATCSASAYLAGQHGLAVKQP